MVKLPNVDIGRNAPLERSEVGVKLRFNPFKDFNFSCDKGI